MKYILLCVLLTSCTCRSSHISEREQRVYNLHYNEKVVIKTGFYKGCEATLNERNDFYYYNASLTCEGNYIGPHDISVFNFVDGYYNE